MFYYEEDTVKRLKVKLQFPQILFSNITEREDIIYTIVTDHI